MNNLNKTSLILSANCAILGSTLGFIYPVVAQEINLPETLLKIEAYETQNSEPIGEYQPQDLAQGFGLSSFTRVEDLKDVTPRDWAYEALVNLINNYRCLGSYDDQTFRGNQSLTRYEFAAALDACLRKIQTFIDQDLPNEQDLEQIQRLQREFAAELNAFANKLDDTEQRVTFLEDRIFATNSVLRGSVDFVVASAFGDQKAVPSGEDPSEDLDSVVTFGGRARLDFDTSFTGRDLLRVRIDGGNISGYGGGVTGTQMTFLGVSTNTGNNIRLSQIFYRFPIGENGNAYVAGARQSASAFVPTLNRASTISLFGFNNPLYDLGFGAGGGAYYQFSDLLGAGVTYYAGSANNPSDSKGLFNGDYGALGQVTLTPTNNLGISLTYAHFFSPEPGSTNNVTGFTGSQFAQLPFGGETATASDNFNVSLSYQLNSRIELGGWVGYTTAEAKSSPVDSGFDGSAGDNADIWTWALTTSYNDIGKLGSKLSFIIGMPPKLTDNEVSDREDSDTSLHLELSYSYPLTENITITPGILAITNPEHNNNNDTILVGLIRTNFSF